MFQTKVERENQNTHFVFSNFIFFRKSCRLVENVEKYCRAVQATKEICRMRIACWIPKATDTRSENVIRIALTLQQYLHDRPSLLRFTHIASILVPLIQ